MVFDLFQPFLYYLEKQAAHRLIPDVGDTTNRLKLADYDSSGLSTPKSTFDHSKWDAVLKRHVSTGSSIGEITGVHTVDYNSLSKDADFDFYLGELAKVDPEELSPPEQLAFWMNAYNALCINLIVQAERDGIRKLNSINDLSTRGNSVWDKPAGEVHGEPISLNEIEHERLRKTWAEPGVHACIVCASASCPNLRREAFVAHKLREQIKDQIRDWMSNPTKGLKLQDGQMFLSRIFLWFEKDFGGEAGIRQWLPEFVYSTAAEAIGNKHLPIRFFEYSWKINRT